MGSKGDVLNSLDIIPVRCNQCQKKFGVRTRSAGKEVACPHCKAPQVAPTIAPQRSDQPRATEQNVASENRDTSPAVDGTTTSDTAATAAHSISPDVYELLPPRYRVPQSLELTATTPVSKIKTAKIKMQSGFEIDTGTLRLTVGDTVAEVRTLTREKRDQRKRIRVAIVYLVGIIVLVGVFWWLMSRTVVELP